MMEKIPMLKKNTLFIITAVVLLTTACADGNENDLFSGIWHGTLSGQAVDIPYEDLGFRMDIRNLEIGTLQEPEGGMATMYFRPLDGSAQTVYRNPQAMAPELRAFLNRYETTGSLEGVMYTEGFVYEAGEPIETGWHIDLERDGWQPGGWEELLTDEGWVHASDFKDGTLTVSSLWHLKNIDVVPSENNNRLTLSKSKDDPFTPDSYEIHGVLYRITHEEELFYPDDLDPEERISTDEHTRNWIHIPDVADVLVSPGSEVEVSQDVKATCLEQFKGSLMHKVGQLDPDHTYEVQAPQAVMGVRGTTLWTHVGDNGQMSVDLLEGDVDLNGMYERIRASGDSRAIVLSGKTDSLRLYETAVSEIRESGQVDRLDMHENSTLLMADGQTSRLRALGSSRIQMAGGSAESLRAEGNSVVELFGGDVDELKAVESASIYVYGENFTLGGDLQWAEAHEITGTGTLSGEWHDQDTAFAVNITQNCTNVVLQALPYPAATDSGIPYCWLISHGLPTDGSVDQSDPHDKGMTVQEDYTAGTDPTDPSSVFKIEEIERKETSKIYFTPNAENRLYTLWRSSGLGDWEAVSGQETVPGGEGPLVDSDSEDAASVFYRIEVVLP